MKKNKTRICCSKKILVVSYTITVLLTVATFICALLSECDITAIATITGLSWADTTAGTAFYYAKAKAENKLKLTRGMIEDLADKYGIESVIQIVGITLSE